MDYHQPLVKLPRNLGSFQIPEVLVAAFESLLSIDRLNRCYEEIKNRCSRGESFFAAGLKATDVEYQVPDGDVLRVPEKGPLVVVSNHPFGSREAFILGCFLLQVRPDIKFMANHLLSKMPEIQPWILPVDPFGGEGAAARNAGSMKEALRWLKKGGCLVIFPAGTVSHWHFKEWAVTDPEWSSHMASLARRTEASVLPVYFEGRNSLLFQLAGLVHPLLRTLLLPNEIFNSRGKITKMFCGRALPPEKLEGFRTDRSLADFLRMHVYLGQKRSSLWSKPVARAEKARKKEIALMAAVNPADLKKEIESLPDSCLLFHQVGFSAYVGEARQMPLCLAEISRLREKTFRQVGEGTGKAFDQDRYDEDYLHLFLWNDVSGEIAGAYRLGLVDQVLMKRGRRGLYSSTLFNYKPSFLKELGPAIELGRSFIRSEYQKQYHPLLLLWKGIGVFLCRNPRYRKLFGPVSISREYHALSKYLMVQFFLQDPQEGLARHVTAKCPPRLPYSPGLQQNRMKESSWSIENISALVTEVEDDGKDIPVLLRHYWKMNAKILCFNEDAAFSDVWDGLIVVDLDSSDPVLLKKFMGERLRDFLEGSSIAG